MQRTRFVTVKRCHLHQHSAFAPPLNLRVDVVSPFSSLVGRLILRHVRPEPRLRVRELFAVRLNEGLQLRERRRALSESARRYCYHRKGEQSDPAKQGGAERQQRAFIVMVSPLPSDPGSGAELRL